MKSLTTQTMHVLLITPHFLQNTLLQNALKRHNIKSLLCLPSSLTGAWLPQTDALCFPDLLNKEDWKNLFPFLLNISPKLPLIFRGKIAQAQFSEHPLKSFLKQAIFLDDTLSVDDIPILIKDFLLKSPLLEQGKCLQVGDFTLDRSQRLARYKGQESFLTKKEYFLLELLLQNTGHVTSRESIVDYVWDKSSYVCANTIDVYISRLRKKIKVQPKTLLIQTIPCLGYQFIPPPS